LAQTQPNTISRYFDQVRISNARITCYRDTYPDKLDQEAKEKRVANLSRGKYNGYLSHKTKIKIREYLHNWIGSVEQALKMCPKHKNKLRLDWVFVTLTLPCNQNHTDQEIKKGALKPFLHQMERLHGWRNWLYVCETQKNGNIHFHIVGDARVNHREIRDLWNGYLRPLGYIQDYRDAQEYKHRNGFNYNKQASEHWTFEKQQVAYMNGLASNWSDPNTTDIKRIKHVYNLPAYLTKYITKSDSTRPIEGRLWGCSDKIRDIKPITIPLTYRTKQIFQQLADEKGSQLFRTDFNWTLWRFDLHTLMHQYPVLAEIWHNYNYYSARHLYPELKSSQFFKPIQARDLQYEFEFVSV